MEILFVVTRKDVRERAAIAIFEWRLRADPYRFAKQQVTKSIGRPVAARLGNLGSVNADESGAPAFAQRDCVAIVYRNHPFDSVSVLLARLYP